MENTWGMQPAPSGMNFSAAPAAAMWWDTCPIGAQQFRGSTNETPPTQTHEPLVDVLEEIGIGSTNGSHTILDIKAFRDSIGDRPIFNRSVMLDAANQLTAARYGRDVTLTNYRGERRVRSAQRLLLPNQIPVLLYAGIHHLVDQWQDDRINNDDISPILIDSGQRVEELGDVNDFSQLMAMLDLSKRLWRKSHLRSHLLDSVQKLKHTARISNIVCIGLGTLHTLDPNKNNPIIQHVVASALAQYLTRMYEAEGMPLEKPIRIIAQDPAYTLRDRQILSKLPVPIEVVTDPEGFLAINESSLVYSAFAMVPVKQIVADLAAATPDGKGPAALFVNNDFRDKIHGNVDRAVYDRDQPGRLANPETKRYLTMLGSYTRVMDGQKLKGMFYLRTFPTGGYNWFTGMDIWARGE
ncbi:uncharacterized protein J4E79_002808 [Alternaria viburni]|uniref:uncharacterized protein n=1 Tax=Alternaria viburni TaxID=566460 RepID=UPI0020C32FBB|nr:uncharacterized protein J4E79_002808 [Alternaria viburni]KAI4666768.1 hypothetical protein J4E79_002808 [Alternaria viburni]